MDRKPIGTLSAVDAQDIMSRVYGNVRDLMDMGVQVAFIANGVSATVELSAYRRDGGLKTLSIVVFPSDKQKKLSFLDAVMDTLRHEDAYTAIRDGMKEYNQKFLF